MVAARHSSQTSVKDLHQLRHDGFDREVFTSGAVCSCSAAYKGVLLSTNARPGWKDARWLGGYLVKGNLLFIVSAVISLLFESWLVRFVYVKIPHTEIGE